jgi:GT2 family glycosyltransferase/glycosyltransferase involved in cell wall biosynthesis
MFPQQAINTAYTQGGDGGESNVIDVVIPVYKGLAETRQCIESVLKNQQKQAFELVVVDDAAPDPGLAAYLDDLAARDAVTLLRNETNLGFVRSVNLGMSLHPRRDVVLLNSDTVIANDWLDRLRNCAYGAPDIGTVTPFSNNATICSYPLFCAENALPSGIGLSDLDRIFSRVNRGKSVVIPTAVGFCMYIRRACLDQIGLFDAGNFGKGYGEENDFSRRAARMGWLNILCADTFVYHAGGVSFQSERDVHQARGAEALRRLHPDYDELVRSFIAADPVRELRLAVDSALANLQQPDCCGQFQHEEAQKMIAVEAQKDIKRAAAAFRAAADFRPANSLDGGPVQLHVIHDFGGGAAQWLRDFSLADAGRTNLVLKPYCHSHAFGEGLALYARVTDETPVRLWQFATPIQATVVSHPEYRRAIEEIVRDFCVDAVVVSSLLGHSLDVLDTGLATVIVNHDYFPYCPAFNIYYQGVCRHCNDERLADCSVNNKDFNAFLNFPAEERILVRKKFLDLVVARNITMVVPSHSVEENLVRLDARFRDMRFEIIPHGHNACLTPLDRAEFPGNGKLRVLVLGQLSLGKGVRLLLDGLEEIISFAEVFLVGCGEVGELFRNRPAVHVVSSFRLVELQAIVEKIRPDVGLLLSICPETFSYTLSELMELGIPTLATNVGSFSERIRQRETGFLFEPDADSLLRALRVLDADRAGLAVIRSSLLALAPRTAKEMVADYHRILPLQRVDHPEYPMVSEFGSGQGVSQASDEAVLSQAAALSDMWKEIKKLHLMLGLKEDVLRQTESRQAQTWRALIEEDERVRELTVQRTQLEKQLEKQSQDKNQLQEAIHSKDVQLAEILASTSWRLSSPVRWVGLRVRKVKILARCLSPLFRDPKNAPATLLQLFRIWRFCGMLALKLALLRLPKTGPRHEAWVQYRHTFDQAVKTGILSRIAEMPAPPLISILMPTYNTPERMLRETLDSVLNQLYPHWELCVADDGSPQPHVKKILQKYAARDGRIKLFLGEENRGVSHASNRALSLAGGEFVVLLDHDDILEEQTLFRVAECVRADDPDMVYSDEVLVSWDGSTVMEYVFRPAFSPELLRSHPYIVHLVGFRTRLLTEIGGFDETLGISQDYDLILRASEKAGCIVHIPEILYRWRIHGNSAGHQKMQQVMEVSKGVLIRHLERCHESGQVSDGPGFNFFDIRYPLAPQARVAIIIPTKNHGELVRQCIESIERTVREVAFDIVLIDHASDDLASLAYFETLKSRLRVLRYEGVFNFSAINNWAVSRLEREYSHFLFCNNDIEAIKPGWLERMMELGQNPTIGIVGAKLFYPDRKTIQHAGVCVGAFGRAEHYGKFLRLPDDRLEPGYLGGLVINHEVSAVTAACLLISKKAFDEVHGFDERIAVGFGDVDLCLKVGQKGYRVVFCPYAELVHHESYTRGTSAEDTHPEDTALYRDKWQALLNAGDFYYNPNLSLYSTTWDFNFPLVFKPQIRRRVYRHSPAVEGQAMLYSPPVAQ